MRSPGRIPPRPPPPGRGEAARKVRIRPEEAGDRAAVRAVNETAFGSAAEADIVDGLRAAGAVLLSLVAERGDDVIGHILFSPVTLGDFAFRGIVAGLGPMAVTPPHQRDGVGSALVRAGLAGCRDLGVDAVVLIGHPGYYPRFGFIPAERFGLRSEYDVPPEVFMALELRPAALRGVRGLVSYHRVFAGGGE